MPVLPEGIPGHVPGRLGECCHGADLQEGLEHVEAEA